MALKNKIRLLNELANKRVVKQFAAKYDLVYFGRVDPRGGDYELVRGATTSTTHLDEHYTVGTINGRDVTIVERHNNLTFPGKPPAHLRWLILQVDLTRDDLPHVFIDFHQHDETFYANLFARLPQLKDITSIFGENGQSFAKHGRVFGQPQKYGEISDLMTNDLIGTLIHNFRHFDFEIAPGNLYVYASKTRPSLPVLDDMVRVGLWMADQLDQSIS